MHDIPMIAGQVQRRQGVCVLGVGEIEADGRHDASASTHGRRRLG
jgi:hypothetical protein